MATPERDPEAVSRIILDPTVLFTEEALTWLDSELLPFLAVSEALYQRLQEPEPDPVLLEYAEGDSGLVARVREELARSEITRFSLEEVIGSEALPEGARAICEALLQSDEPLGDVLADEWAFLTSQSLAIIARRVRDSLVAFAKHGAQVIEVSRKDTEDALNAVQDKIPPGVLRIMKHADDRFVKFVVWGGGAVSLIVPPLHLPMAIANAARAGVAIVAGDP
ncbi:MAG TPA: hypothetical protein VFP21_00830 [Solirubrobacterales bacterium]|nr:hypothetical protein [Solirubrobacterales bacterium]